MLGRYLLMNLGQKLIYKRKKVDLKAVVKAYPVYLWNTSTVLRVHSFNAMNSLRKS